LTRDVELEARIKFNRGSVTYASGLKGASNPPEVIGLLKSAIVHYRDALELDPEDDDARINIEFGQQLIRNLLEKLNQQQEVRQQQQGGQQEANGGQQRRGQIGEPEHDHMTRQEAERLLQAGRDREWQHRNEIARRLRVGRIPVAED
jgi:hypothetical protein